MLTTLIIVASLWLISYIVCIVTAVKGGCLVDAMGGEYWESERCKRFYYKYATTISIVLMAVAIVLSIVMCIMKQRGIILT